MKCPYCGGELPEEALACQHCHRDLVVVKPLLARIAALERALAELKGRSLDASPRAPAGAFPAMLAAAVGVFATASFFFAKESALGKDPLSSLAAYLSSDLAVYLAVALPPAALGILLASTWPGEHIRAFVLSGFAMGGLNLAAGWALLSNPYSEFNWPWALLLFLVFQPLIFATGGWIGSKVRREPPAEGERAEDLGKYLKELIRPALSHALTLILGWIVQRYLQGP